MTSPSLPGIAPQFNRHVSEFFKIFTLLDEDNDGVLNESDIRKLLQKLNYTVSKEDISNLINYMSMSGTNKTSIEFPVFLNWLNKTLHSGRIENRLSGIFSVLDENKDGKVSPSEVTRLVTKLGLNLEISEATSLLGGDADFATFCNLLAKSLPE